jgi:hypothetical protein
MALASYPMHNRRSLPLVFYLRYCIMIQSKFAFAAAALLSIVFAGSGLAQQQGPGGGGPGGRPNFDPAQFRQMMLDRMRDQLGAPDDEWKVLQPKIEAVMTAQQASRSGGPGGPGGPGGGGQDQKESAVQTASRELRKAIEDKRDPELVQQKLVAYREARAAARQQVKDAQAALRELLTLRQEAVLVDMGTLE